MAKRRVLKLRKLDARHPGLCQKVDAMFDAFATLGAVAAMIRAEYGEHITATPIARYKKQFWNVRRQRDLMMKAASTAYQELVSERRD